jgi:hypothetical protein
MVAAMLVWPGLSDETDHQVAVCGHDTGPYAGFDVGGVFTERDIPNPVDLVLEPIKGNESPDLDARH